MPLDRGRDLILQPLTIALCDVGEDRLDHTLLQHIG